MLSMMAVSLRVEAGKPSAVSKSHSFSLTGVNASGAAVVNDNVCSVLVKLLDEIFPAGITISYSVLGAKVTRVSPETFVYVNVCFVRSTAKSLVFPLIVPAM